MRSLDQARAVCESYLPGLLDALRASPLAELESPGSPGIQAFRDARGPALLIPTEYGGMGAGPLDAVRITRAIGSVSPSLAVATTMHHFSVATVFTLADSVRRSGLEWALLEVIANNNLLVASGFAEGRPQQGILSPTMTARKVDGGYRVTGSKKPCSLSRSMDLLTAAISVTDADGEPALAFLLMPATLEGLSRHPFWTSRILAGAESDEVRLTDVFVEDELVLPTDAGDAAGLDDLQTLGFIWFELLISSCYLGAASALVERVLDGRKGAVATRAAMGTRLETAAQLLEGAARRLAEGVPEKEDGAANAALADALIARFGVQDAIGDAARTAVELLGGMAFIRSDDVSYLAAAHQALGFHPPSRASTDASLVDYLEGSGPVLVS